jgi:ABC-type transport system substrate-binding protein
MQAILYEDLPDIVLVYPKSLFGFKEGLDGIDPLLLGAGVDRYEYWDDPADNSITYAIPANLAEWNTYVQESFYDGLWMQGVYGALYARAPVSNVYEPQIAADLPTFTADLQSMSVDIAAGATFSNGDPVLAEDVAYSIELHMTPAVGSSSYSYYNTWFADNSSVYAFDSDTVCFNMTDVNAFALGTISFAILDKSTVEPLIAHMVTVSSMKYL